MMIGQNTLIGIYNPTLPLKIRVLGNLTEQHDANNLLGFIEETYPELYKIIDCESDFRPDVCSYAGCDAGQGLAQIIPSTLRYCEEKLMKDLDVWNPTDNLECAIWLYSNEGNHHWSPSEACWKS
jgi:hypothetical protein